MKEMLSREDTNIVNHPPLLSFIPPPIDMHLHENLFFLDLWR